MLNLFKFYKNFLMPKLGIISIGGGSAPPAPDYRGAAQEQATASKEVTNMQTWANRPTQNTPWGTQSWNAQAVVDPATGQPVTQWTQNTTLAPGLQQALNNQIGLQNDRSQLASGFMQRVANEYSQPFNWSTLPQMASLGQAPSVSAGVADYTPGLRTNVNPLSQNLQTGFDIQGPRMGMNTMSEQVQRGLATGDNPSLPQIDSGFRNQVADQLFQRMQPVHDYQTRALETKLANQGLRPGSEAYNRAMTQLGQQQAQERFNALDQSGNEAQRLFGMQMGARQQAFNEDVGSGQFANQATGQAFNQGLQAFNFGNQAQNQAYNQMMGLSNLNNQANQQAFNQNLQAAQFGNQALGQASALDIARQNANNQALQQQFGMNQQAANFQNQLRQQAIAEQAQRRGMSLNEMNALLTGQQVSMPQMPGFNQAQRSETPNILGATQMGYDAQLGAYNAQQAANANMMSGLGSLASTAFMFSDRRLKSNIKRVGTHEIGVGIYEYTMMGMPQRGVIAQEVEAVRPDLVKRHANGFLMVDYGGL